MIQQTRWKSAIILCSHGRFLQARSHIIVPRDRHGELCSTTFGGRELCEKFGISLPTAEVLSINSFIMVDLLWKGADSFYAKMFLGSSLSNFSTVIVLCYTISDIVVE